VADYRQVIAIWPLAFLIAASAEPGREQSYLVSIVDVPLEAGESIERFALSSQGVSYQAICRLPEGWMIKAGTDIGGGGVLEGEGSNGVTWLPQSSPPELEDLALITLDIETAPKSFSGSATIESMDGERDIILSSKNVRLKAANGCRGHSVR
jgi:hypothetical protein